MQKNNSQQLNEGLRPLDLKEMVYPVFEIDTYSSKMGEDRDVCVISFEVKDRAPARDLMEFIEKGYNFVLDSDVSSGENERGEYFVFVEISRTPQLSEQIEELIYGVNKLTGIDSWDFKYHKQSNLHEANSENLKNIIPKTPESYDGLLVKVKTESIKKFFNKTLMDDLSIDGDVITIHKPFDQRIQLRIVEEGATEQIIEGSTAPYIVDQAAMSEIFWLTKVLGDYNINKVGENFIFDNKGRSMILQRI
jgi:hypothetical protein